MDEEANGQHPSLLWRVGFFFRDFALESYLQLLLPLGSFLLGLGWTYWLWVPARRAQVDYLLADGIVRSAVRFAYTASVVLWCVRVRNPIRKFVWWVFLPIALGAISFLGLLVLLPGNVSVLDSEFQITRGSLRALPSQLAHLDYGAWFTLLGAAVLAVSLRAVRSGRMSLPVRFRDSTAQTSNVLTETDLARLIFKLVVILLVMVTIIEFATGYLFALAKSD